MTFEASATDSARGPIYPPALAQALCALMPEHPLLVALGRAAIAQFLSEVFFASLQEEEGEHQVIHVTLTTETVDAASRSPAQLRFRGPCSFTSRNLLRLARAVRSERMVITVFLGEAGLQISGLARERFGADARSSVAVRALRPGCLEIWVSGERILEYVRGYIQKPPEDLLWATGPVRDKLLAFAREPKAPSGYIESIADLLRHLADQPHGGILILRPQIFPQTLGLDSFAMEPNSHLWDLLVAMESASASQSASLLERESIRSEIQSWIAELGCLTALDGATILDRRLGLCSFGAVLPVRADVSVLEVVDAAAQVVQPFPLQQYGARHRAAASYAANHPGCLVFLASITGDIGCMLQDEGRTSVLLWRFRSADLSSPIP